MKNKAIEKLDKLKKKIEDEDLKVTGINERVTSRDNGSIEINYQENSNNGKSIGF